MSFVFVKVIFFNQNTKSVCIHATKDGVDAIIIMEKLQFDISCLPSNLVFDESNSQLLLKNDLYEYFLYNDASQQYNCKVNVLFPATEAHFKKYQQSAKIIFLETQEIFVTIVEPYIATLCTAEKLRWVYNILENGAEADRLLYKNDCQERGFYLFPDSKWDGINISSLYLQAICTRKDIRCLRDLTSAHLPLLKEMLSVIPAIVQEKYSLPANKLRLMVHYHPTYFHFHVHVINISAEITAGCLVGQAHLLAEIVDAIENVSSDYWQRKSISILLYEQHPLFSALSNL